MRKEVVIKNWKKN